MDIKFYVSYEAARLLKEKGYDEETEYTIDNNGRMWLGEHRDECDFPAPTKAEAIDWLDTKEIVIEISSVRNRKWKFSIYKNGWFQIDSWIHDRLDFPTRLEAEEAAIIKALELL